MTNKEAIEVIKKLLTMPIGEVEAFMANLSDEDKNQVAGLISKVVATQNSGGVAK